MNITVYKLLNITPLCNSKALADAYTKAMEACDFECETRKLEIHNAHMESRKMLGNKNDFLHTIQSAQDLNGVLGICSPKTIFTILEKLEESNALDTIINSREDIITALTGIPKNNALSAIIILRRLPYFTYPPKTLPSNTTTFAAICTNALEQASDLVRLKANEVTNTWFPINLSIFATKKSEQTSTPIVDANINEVMAIGVALSEAEELISSYITNHCDRREFLNSLELITYVHDNAIEGDEIAADGVVYIPDYSAAQNILNINAEKVVDCVKDIPKKNFINFLQILPNRVAIQCLNLLNHDAHLTYQDAFDYLPLSIKPDLRRVSPLFIPININEVDTNRLLQNTNETCRVLNELNLKQNITTNSQVGNIKFSLLLQIQRDLNHHSSKLPNELSPQQKQLLIALLQLTQYVCQIETNIASEWTMKLTNILDNNFNTSFTKTKSLQSLQSFLNEEVHTPPKAKQANELEQHVVRFLSKYQLSPINVALLLLCNPLPAAAPQLLPQATTDQESFNVSVNTRAPR